jgi:hypothetical protein
MTRIYTSAMIACPIETLYNYVTTPAHWLEWHPSSLGVSDGADHSLLVGERAAPIRWVIQGAIKNSRGGGTITYTLSQRPDSVFFEREFIYPAIGPLIVVLDALVLRRIQAESEEATRRLKAKMGARV